MLSYKIHNQVTNTNTPHWIFVGGYTGTYEVWYPLLDIMLKQQNIPVILIDNLGSGTSPQP